MTRYFPLLLVAAGLLSACGDETALWVTVDLSAFAVPAEVDLVHLELRDGETPLIGRSFAPTEERPLYRLLPGPRTPARFDLVAYAYLGDQLVGQSPVQAARFDDGEARELTLVVSRL